MGDRAEGGIFRPGSKDSTGAPKWSGKASCMACSLISSHRWTRPKGSTGMCSRTFEHLIGAGVHGLTPLGSTGEFAYLDREQRLEIVDVVVQATRGRVPVIAGVAATTTREAVALARAVMERGADGVLAVLEAYFPVSEHGVERSALVRCGSMARSALTRSINTPLCRHLRRHAAQRPWRE